MSTGLYVDVCTRVYTHECMCVRLYVHVTVPGHATADSRVHATAHTDSVVCVSALFCLCSSIHIDLYMRMHVCIRVCDVVCVVCRLCGVWACV